jgi:hypothetical protein
MSSELLFVGLLFMPTIFALAAWIFKHTGTGCSADTAPMNYWGSYQTSNPSNIRYSGIRLPELQREDLDSSSHMHTIGVHP